MTRLLCPSLIDLGVYRRPWLSFALLFGTWSALEHSMNDRQIHLDFSYRSPGNEIVSEKRETLAFMMQECCSSHNNKDDEGLFWLVSCKFNNLVEKRKKKRKRQVQRRMCILVWESAWISNKCEQWEEKNVWSSFSCLKHTTEPFWRLTSRRITAPKCCTVYLVSMLQEAAAIYCMYTAEVVSDTRRRPSRTVRCNLCSLARTEPHWQAAFCFCASLNVFFTKWSYKYAAVIALQN